MQKRPGLLGIPSTEGLGGMVASNVPSNACQVVAKLVASSVDHAYDRPRQSCTVKRKVSKRDDIVITAMIEEQLRDLGKFPSNAARQLKVVEVPTIFAPRRGSKQK